jgi:transposase
MTSPGGEGAHGEGYDHWNRLGKASLPSPCGVEGRPAVLRKKVSRAQLLGFLTKQPPAMVAMEACATAHDWGRAISGLGRDVRLVPPI